MLRWRVVATDNTGVTGTAPQFSDPIDNEQYYGTVAVDSTIADEPAGALLVHSERDAR